jgi:hypothetical protein
MYVIIYRKFLQCIVENAFVHVTILRTVFKTLEMSSLKVALCN